jgi:hypothetical protein
MKFWAPLAWALGGRPCSPWVSSGPSNEWLRNTEAWVDQEYMFFRRKRCISLLIIVQDY